MVVKILVARLSCLNSLYLPSGLNLPQDLEGYTVENGGSNFVGDWRFVEVSLLPVIDAISAVVGDQWRQLALSRLPTGSTSSVWSRFVIGFLRDRRVFANDEELRRLCETIETYQQFLFDDQPKPAVPESKASLPVSGGFQDLAERGSHQQWLDIRHRDAARLLLHFQLEHPPRDEIESQLQHSVLADETRLAVYCDYLEEQGDPIAEWLRRLA